MQEKSSFFIIDRYKKMSYITRYIPVEYSAKEIVSDLEKAGIDEALTEDEIRSFIEKSKNSSYEKILSKIKDGSTVFDIMQWCRLSTDCVIPICNFQCSIPGKEAVAYGYFNYEVKRIVENELERILRSFRKDNGPGYNAEDLVSFLEKENIYNLSNEMGMEITAQKLSSMISDFEKNSVLMITEYVLKSWSEPETLEKSESDPGVVFSHSELLEIVPEIIRKERFRAIGRTVVGMKNSEIIALIGAVEKMRLLKIIRSDTGLDNGSVNENDNYSSEYMKHAASLSQDDLSDLIETLRAYMNWRSLFSFVQTSQKIPGKKDLTDSIISGFSESNGIKMELFKTFVISED
jgi:hypothetical protein